MFTNNIIRLREKGIVKATLYPVTCKVSSLLYTGALEYTGTVYAVSRSVLLDVSQ
jgi:hypothetical protein